MQEIAYSNPTKFPKPRDLEEYFINEYGNIKFDLKNIPSSELKQLENKYKVKKDKINDILSLQKESYRIIHSLNSYIRKKTSLENLINEMEIDNEKITNVLNVSFYRNSKEYNKKIYILMTSKMKHDIKDNENNIQVFCDTTYHALPSKNTHFKLWLLVGFNKIIFKTIILCIALIKNENEETFKKIFKYLKDRFDFNPPNITMDMCKAQILAAREIFPTSNIILCFFHYIQRIIKHLPQIKSTNLIKKQKAKDLLSNLKLIIFLEEADINTFFKKIKTKFEKEFSKFLKYFEKTFFHTKPYNENLWCYYKIRNNYDNDIFFFTNNICESTNRSLNINYIGGCNSFLNFYKAITDLIFIFENKDSYDENKLSITRAINYYVTKNKNIELITNNKLLEILKEYENHLLKEKIPFKKIPDLDDFLYEIKKDDINTENLQSDNYLSDSSISGEESESEKVINLKNKDNDGDGGDNDKGNDNGDNRKNSNSKKKYNKNNKNDTDRSKKINYPKNKKGKKCNEPLYLNSGIKLDIINDLLYNDEKNLFCRFDNDDEIFSGNKIERIYITSLNNSKLYFRKLFKRKKLFDYRVKLLNNKNFK